MVECELEAERMPVGSAPERAYSFPPPLARTAGGTCYGARWWATFVAREVHQADAANLRTNRTAPAKGDADAQPTWSGPLMKTARERAEEKRQEKLAFVAEQVENGELVVRQMTEEERRRYPPRPPQPKRVTKR